jgi:ornithine carbamoyltransferase
MNHVRSISEIGLERMQRLLLLADRMGEINSRPVPKVPALRGRTVVSLFYEDSTRTRLSFETAARRLSADTMNFSVSSSSVNKGESLRDTVETISDMGVDAFVVRHKSAGVPWQIAKWTDAVVINAGDGAHQHPTQALLDCYTITRARVAPLIFRGYASPSLATSAIAAWRVATSMRSLPLAQPSSSLLHRRCCLLTPITGRQKWCTISIRSSVKSTCCTCCDCKRRG